MAKIIPKISCTLTKKTQNLLNHNKLTLSMQEKEEQEKLKEELPEEAPRGSLK